MRHGGRCVGKYKKGDILNRKGRGSGTRIVRTRLIKGDITGNTEPTSNRIPTSIALVLITIAKKDTLNRLSGQFGAFAGS